jgi:glycine oxidase
VTATYDVIVVGAGPIGTACARELALAGGRVLLLDPNGERGQAWRAAAGMLAPQIEAHEDDPMLPLGLAGRELYAGLAASLKETTGVDIGLWQEGIAWAAATEAEAGELKSKVAAQRQRGHLSDWLDAGEVRARWPWLGQTAGALWAPMEGALEPARLVQGLLADAQLHGAQVVQDEVTSLEQRGDRVVGVAGPGGRYAAGEVVIAAGAWSGTIAGLPRPLSVAPVRGQMAAFPWPRDARRAIVYGHGTYLLARGSEAIAGSTMEYVGFQPEVTPEGLGRLLSGLTALYPELDHAKVIRTWAGLRPMTPDGLPIIGAEPRLQGLWYATGHGRNGILLAAITGLIVRQLLAGEQAVEDLVPFSPTRFWNW